MLKDKETLPQDNDPTEQRQKEIFERLIIRVKEELQRKHSSLADLVDGENTKKLSESIPKETLKDILWHYRLFQEACKEARTPAYPKKEFHKITSLLDDLKKTDWLTESDVIETSNLIYQKMQNSPKGYKFAHRQSQIIYAEKGTAWFAGQTKLFDTRQRGGPKKDIALDFLIFVLVKNLQSVTGKYPLIAKFLFEHRIAFIPSDKPGDDPYEIQDTTIRKRYERITSKTRSFNTLLLAFLFVRRAYLNPIFDRIFYYPDIPEELRQAFREEIIPPLEKFLNIQNRT